MIPKSTLRDLPELADFEARVLTKLAGGDRPWVTLKAGASLDGRIATRHGESRWISSEESRRQAHLLRGAHDAILCGIGTVLADDPALTVRHGTVDGTVGDTVGDTVGVQPARVVLDSRARIDPAAHCLRTDGARRLVIVGSEAPLGRLRDLEASGVEVLRAKTPRPTLDFVLPTLRTGGLERVLVEGGGQVHGSFVATGEADALFLWVAAMILGDAAAPAWCTGPELAHLARAHKLNLSPPRSVGPDVLLHALFQQADQRK